jgi:hypothetical protein
MFLPPVYALKADSLLILSPHALRALKKLKICKFTLEINKKYV